MSDYSAALEIVKKANASFIQLRGESLEAVEGRRDVFGYEQKMIQRAQILVDLPGQLTGLPADIMEEFTGLASDAKGAIETRDAIQLALLAENFGADDKTQLDVLLERLEALHADEG